MSDVLERIRRELQQRLQSTHAAAQEHERVRAALEAPEHVVAPLEKVARRAAGGATQPGAAPPGGGVQSTPQAGLARTGSPGSPAAVVGRNRLAQAGSAGP
jgi:hypothetical protein